MAANPPVCGNDSPDGGGGGWGGGPLDNNRINDNGRGGTNDKTPMLERGPPLKSP